MWERMINGLLYLQERAYDPLTGRSRTVSVRINPDNAKGRKTAQKTLLARLEEYKPKEMRLSDLIEAYKKELVRTVRPSTFERNSCSLRSSLKILDDVYVSKLTAGYIKRKLIETGKPNVYINEQIKRLKSMLKWAYMNDILPDNTIYDKLQKLPDPEKHDRIENKFLEKEELNALVDKMDNERWKLLTRFLALSGLRIGEAAALNNDDMDTEYITVSKSFSTNYRELGATKTKGSNREVYIQPELAETIRKIRVCMMIQRMRYGYEDRGFFFAGPTGDRIEYPAYAKYLRETAKKVVPNKQVTPHTLRHTMTSLFAEAGVSLEVISRRLGHENSEITQQIYLHVTKARKRMDNEEIKSINLFG